MNSIKIVYIVEFLFLFIAVLLILNSILLDKKEKKIKGTSIYKTLSTKTIIYIILAAVGMTFMMTSLTGGTLTKIVIFVTIIAFAPYFIKNNSDMKKTEKLYNDVVVYCSNMSVLLTQYKNVYTSLDKVQYDVGPELQRDIIALRDSFDEGREATKQVMKEFENKYRYSCVISLDIILFVMKWEDEKRIPKENIQIYLDEINSLQKDINENKIKRKSMRITYFGLSIGSYLMYLYFLNSLSSTSLANLYTTKFFESVSLVYNFLMILFLFLVDRYFCTHLFRE